MKKILFLPVLVLLILGFSFIATLAESDKPRITNSTELNAFLDNVNPNAKTSVYVPGKITIIEADGRVRSVEVEINSSTTRVLEERNILSNNELKSPSGLKLTDLVLIITFILVVSFVINSYSNLIIIILKSQQKQLILLLALVVN